VEKSREKATKVPVGAAFIEKEAESSGASSAKKESEGDGKAYTVLLDGFNEWRRGEETT